FPNPVNDVLTIKAQKEVDYITVYNMLGQVVKRQTPNTRDCTVDLSAMQTGAYFVQVSIDNSVETIRILKN
ncbi:MAG: T9SS type A sorting domain-containing protein, partial [Flavobacteriaceae bacterium]